MLYLFDQAASGLLGTWSEALPALPASKAAEGASRDRADQRRWRDTGTVSLHATARVRKQRRWRDTDTVSLHTTASERQEEGEEASKKLALRKNTLNHYPEHPT